MKELKDILQAFALAREPMALATIVSTKGSSYRRAGTRMLTLADGQTKGTLSGGCIEEEVAEQSLEVIRSGVVQRFTIDTLQRFGCPGSLDILVERTLPGSSFLTYLLESCAARKTAEIVVSLEDPLGSFPAHCRPEVAQGFRQVIQPPVRLLVVGLGSDTEALVQFGRVLGWDVMVLEAAQLADIVADARTALIIKNHHFGRDLLALSEGFSRSFGYVGLLSSMKRKRSLMQMLDEKLVGADDALASFHGPAGLDLGGDAPEEIALSIVSEILAVMAGHTAGFLRDYSLPIHQSRCLTAA